MSKIFRYRRRHGWSAITLLLLTLLIFCAQQRGWLGGAPHAIESNQPGLYSIDHFVDGDTIAVNMNGRVEKVRLIGVDTPETHKPHTPVQCYGPEAAAYTKAQIGHQRLRLVSDSLSTDRDRYGRLLRYAYLADGSNLEEKIIQNGYGFYYPYFPFSKSDLFANDQLQAQAGHKGLWAKCQPAPTDGGGYLSNPQETSFRPQWRNLIP